MADQWTAWEWHQWSMAAWDTWRTRERQSEEDMMQAWTTENQQGHQAEQPTAGEQWPLQDQTPAVQPRRERGASDGDSPASASEHASGDASRHAPSMWQMAFAFVNLGMSGAMLRSDKWWKTHRPLLVEQFMDLLLSDEKPAGIFLNEVGNLSDLLEAHERNEFEFVLREAFGAADAMTHGPPQIYWSNGETVAAFRAEVNVLELPTLEFDELSEIDTWRTVERFAVFGGPEHGSHSMLIYNQHQPSSDLRPF